jgi:hypothetical protein
LNADENIFFSPLMQKAFKMVGESTQIPLAYYLNNVSTTISLLQIMSEYDCTRVVYSSSATVYGTAPKIPIPESSPLKPESPYAQTKVMSENIIADLCRGASSVLRTNDNLTCSSFQPNPPNGGPFPFVTLSKPYQNFYQLIFFLTCYDSLVLQEPIRRVVLARIHVGDREIFCPCLPRLPSAA